MADAAYDFKKDFEALDFNTRVIADQLLGTARHGYVILGSSSGMLARSYKEGQINGTVFALSIILRPIGWNVAYMNALNDWIEGQVA